MIISNPINWKFWYPKSDFGSESSETDPIKQLPAASRQNVHILRRHQEAQEAHSENFRNGQHCDHDGRRQRLCSGLRLGQNRRQKSLHSLHCRISETVFLWQRPEALSGRWNLVGSAEDSQSGGWGALRERNLYTLPIKNKPWDTELPLRTPFESQTVQEQIFDVQILCYRKPIWDTHTNGHNNYEYPRQTEDRRRFPEEIAWCGTRECKELRQAENWSNQKEFSRRENQERRRGTGRDTDTGEHAHWRRNRYGFDEFRSEIIRRGEKLLTFWRLNSVLPVLLPLLSQLLTITSITTVRSPRKLIKKTSMSQCCTHSPYIKFSSKSYLP